MAETATLLQEQVLDSIKTAQEATVKIAKGWTRALSTSPGTAELFSVPKAESLYAFGEKLWGAQKDFFVSMLEVATEAGKTVPDNMKRTAERTAATATK